MRALVKSRAERGIWLEDIDVPDIGHNDVLIRVHRTAILRHGHSYLQMGRMGQQNDSCAACRRPRI